MTPKIDRRILAQALHADRVGPGGLAHCAHGTDFSECSYHAELIARRYEQIARERADYWESHPETVPA